MRLSCATVLMLVLSSGVMAQAPTTQPATPMVELFGGIEPHTAPGDLRQTVAALNDADPAERAVAEKNLLRLIVRRGSSDALRAAALRAAEGHGASEVAVRTKVVLEQPARRDRFARSRFSHNVTGSSLELLEVLEGILDISPQQNDWYRRDLPAGTHTVRFDDTPYWDAVFGLCRTIGVWPQQHGNRLQRSDATFGTGFMSAIEEPVDPADGFMPAALVELVQVDRQRHGTVALQRPRDDQPLADPGQSLRRQLTLQFRLLCEPKLRVQSEINTTIVEAVDETGQSLVIQDDSNRRHYWHGNNGLIRTINVGLDAERGMESRHLDVLRGHFTFEVATGEDELDVSLGRQAVELQKQVVELFASNEPKLTSPVIKVDQTQRVGPYTVTVESIAVPDDMLPAMHQPDRRGMAGWFQNRNAVPDLPGLQIAVRVRGNDLRELRSKMNEFQLLSSDGPWSTRLGSTSYEDEAMSVTLFVTTSGSGDVERLTWSLPTGKETIEVPFLFYDVPLPDP